MEIMSFLWGMVAVPVLVAVVFGAVILADKVKSAVKERRRARMRCPRCGYEGSER